MESVKRTLETLPIIYHIIRRAITGEPFYLLLILPRRERMYVELKDISIPMIDNGFHANLEWIKDNDLAMVRFTEEEEAMIAESEKKN